MAGALSILWRSVLSFVVLFILTRLMGKRQISQLTFFEYVNGITIGSIAAEMCCQTNEPTYEEVIAMAVWALFTVLLNVATRKSLKARRFLNSVPTILVDKGEIIFENMKSTHFEINDLLSEARLAGYFSLSDVMYAVLETNGNVSFLPKSSKRPLTPEDAAISVSQEVPLANVIIDGCVIENNLKSVGRDVKWLENQLKNQKVKDIFLATADQDGNLNVYRRDIKPRKFSLFE